MASISKQPGGRRTIQFVGSDGKRRSIRLGKVSQRLAESVQVKVEYLAAAKATGGALDGETARWVGDLDTQLADKLAAVGLIAPREKRAAETITLAEFIDQYIDTRQKSMNPSTVTNYFQTRRVLLEFFGVDRLLGDITPGSCDDWRVYQETKGYALATIGRHVKRARQFFRAAFRNRMIPENPMQDVRAAAQVNKSREFFVTRPATERIIAACPDAEWRLIVALARYGGVRTPSETFAVAWTDVDWAENRIRIPSPKTKCHAGRESRMLPLFPELRPYLEAVFDEAEPGTTHVIAKHRIGSMNLRTTMERIMGRAGVPTWPRLFQNMRASRETELVQDHPLHVVTAWIGNSARIAARHYLQVTDADFDRAVYGGASSGAVAVQNPVQQPPVTFGIHSQEKQQAPDDQGLVQSVANPCNGVQEYPVTPTGLEPVLQA